jgi:hypothetical protein
MKDQSDHPSFNSLKRFAYTLSHQGRGAFMAVLGKIKR